MRILHYFLGFPPYRSGGLTRFAVDLMETQTENGDKVFALWPGRIRLVGHDISIKENVLKNGIVSCELVNPLPVPYDEGIKNPEWFMKKCKNVDAFEKFVRDNRIEVVHIHTFMGFYSEFLDVLNALNVKTVFTVHDYYPICFRTYLYHHGIDCADNHKLEECAADCGGGLSYFKMAMLQSSVYRFLKDFSAVKFARRLHRGRFIDNESGSTKSRLLGVDKKGYQLLQDHYKNMLRKVSVVHFGSNVAKNVYLKYCIIKKDVVLPLSNKRVVQRDNTAKTESEKLRIAYLADRKRMKGFADLISALDELEKEKPGKVVLNLFGSKVDRGYIHNFGEYFSEKDLNYFFANSDLLIAPSVWHETFGLTVVEALSFHTPVIVGKNVGAKDIIGDGGIVMKENSVAGIKIAIDDVLNGELKLLTDGVDNNTLVLWSDFVKKMYDIYRNT